MSIYIKGMEMPTDGSMIFAIRPNGMVEDVMGCYVGKAVPVPPHGRLIDADTIKKIVASSEHMDAVVFDGKVLYSDHLCVGADYEDVCKAIDESPTIIPAESAKEA